MRMGKPVPIRVLSLAGQCTTDVPSGSRSAVVANSCGDPGGPYPEFTAPRGYRHRRPYQQLSPPQLQPQMGTPTDTAPGPWTYSLGRPFHLPCVAELLAYNAPVKRNSVLRRNRSRIHARSGVAVHSLGPTRQTPMPTNANRCCTHWLHLNQRGNRRIKPAREPCRG